MAGHSGEGDKGDACCVVVGMVGDLWFAHGCWCGGAEHRAFAGEEPVGGYVGALLADQFYVKGVAREPGADGFGGYAESAGVESFVAVAVKIN